VLKRPPLTYPDQPFHQFLFDSEQCFPERTALVADGECYSFRELAACVRAFAAALRSRGVRPSDRVLVALPNSAEWVVAVLATSVLGGAAVLANPRWRSGELEHAIRLTNPAGAVVEDEKLALMTALVDGPCVSTTTRPGGGSAFWDLVHTSSAARLPDPFSDWADREVALPFSSGTSGLPKAVVHTHRTLVAASSLITDGDRLNFFLPLFHIYGLITIANSLSAGAYLTLTRRFELEEMLRTVVAERITVGFGAAPIALAMARHPELEEFDLSSLRYFVWAATPIDRSVADEVTRRSGVRWLHAYGATEAPVISCNPVDHPEVCRLDSPGPPMSDTEVRVVDLISGCLTSGEGELQIRGPQVMAGYLPTEANTEAFVDGWLRTGDVVVVDADGWIRIVDRAKEMVKVNAFQVAPAELEEVLRTHPAVADCVVYGVPDPETGEAPRAAVVRVADVLVGEDELLRWAAERLAGYKRIRSVHFIAEVPRTASGKPLRRVLRDAGRSALSGSE
jgi:long-chain acyl-CoA synthetase